MSFIWFFYGSFLKKIIISDSGGPQRILPLTSGVRSKSCEPKQLLCHFEPQNNHLLTYSYLLTPQQDHSLWRPGTLLI